MRLSATATWILGAIAAVLLAPTVVAQTVVINELVKEQRTAGSGSVNPDTREFVELYNPTGAEVDIGGWSIVTYDLLAGSPLITDTIPAGTKIAAGDYFVIGAAGVPNVDYTPPGTAGIELYPDLQANAIELVDGSSNLVDAVAYDVFRLGFTGLTTAPADLQAQIGSGFQGQALSMDAGSPNTVMSYSRYRDGRDSNSNGRDFANLPITPGTTNNTLPLNGAHTIPNVDAMAPNTALSSQYYSSFVLPTVINPTVASGINPTAIPASPQGGNAIVAWDQTGGGNASYSKELVTSYDLYAYLDTQPIGIATATNAEEWESTAYGIGTTDAFFGNPDPTGGIFVAGTATQNGSSGIGWVYQRYEEPTHAADFQKLVLVDFNDGGNSTPEAGDWTVIQEIDVSGIASGWFRLSLDYDATTGDVTAHFNGTDYTFTTDADLLGNFFVGYREALSAVPGANFAAAAPPIFDLVPAAVDDADFNNNSLVEGSDFLIWQRNNGGAGSNATGDANGDGNVNAADLAIWQGHYGLAQAAANVGAVPEPTTAGLALAVALGCAAVRRRAG